MSNGGYLKKEKLRHHDPVNQRDKFRSYYNSETNDYEFKISELPLAFEKLEAYEKIETEERVKEIVDVRENAKISETNKFMPKTTYMDDSKLKD